MIINLEIPYFSIKCLSIGTPKAISFPFVKSSTLLHSDWGEVF